MTTGIDEGTPPRWPVAVVAALAFLLAIGVLIPGHYWGDDWTLYVRQAEGLIHGKVGTVLADVRFTARHSIAREFTPQGYPWGTPLLLVTPLALFGRNVIPMKVVMQLAFAVTIAAWFVVGRRRVGTPAASAMAACMVISLPILTWTNMIASDIPYLAVVGLATAAFARQTLRADGPDARWQRAALLGTWSALAFAFRQEGLALLLALIVGLGAEHLRASGVRSTAAWRTIGRMTAVAAATFVAITTAVHVLLPSQILPRYATAGVGRIRPNLRIYVHAVGAQFGWYDLGRGRVQASGIPVLGWALLALTATLCAVGLVTILRRHDALDVVLLALAGAHAFSALTFPYPDGRYMFVPVAVAWIAIAQGAVTAARAVAVRLPDRVQARHWAGPTVITLAVLGLVVVVQVQPYAEAARNAAHARADDSKPFTPYERAPQEMFAAVRANTGAHDVVATTTARALTLFTDRRTVQVYDDGVVPDVADWLIASRTPDGDYAAPDGAHEVWSNGRYVLLSLHDG